MEEIIRFRLNASLFVLNFSISEECLVYFKKLFKLTEV